jgi:hypothetical protein
MYETQFRIDIAYMYILLEQTDVFGTQKLSSNSQLTF